MKMVIIQKKNTHDIDKINDLNILLNDVDVLLSQANKDL
jgi:hypothetical protein